MVRFGYDGAGFAGWARQPGLRTVEGTIRSGAVRAGIAPGPEAGRPDVASRTDRGVHAFGNALAISSDLAGAPLLRALNGIAPDVYFRQARSVPPTFRPRQAERRLYRYFEPAAGHRLERMQEAAGILTAPLDVRSFGRGFPAAVPVTHPVDRIDVSPHGDLLWIDVEARSFVWGMVRKIVAALRRFDAGELSQSDLSDAAAGRRRLGLPLAAPDGLVLWDVVYPGPWEFAAAAPSARQSRSLAAARRGWQVRGAVLDALGNVALPGTVGTRQLDYRPEGGRSART